MLKAGEQLPLTKTEFLLLCEFADHADMVLSRDQLLERVWGYDYLGDSRLVDAHVRRLRVKVEDQPEDPKLIVTVRGIGYRLHVPAPDRAVTGAPGQRRRPGASGRDLPQEGLGLVAVAGAAHRRQGPHDVPAVAGLGQAGVEHGDHAAVGRRCGSAGRRPGPAAWPRGGGRCRRKASGPSRSRRASSSGSSGRGNGRRSMVTRRQRAAGHVDALEQPGGGEEAARSPPR